ncbi:MAG TPA: hypothetical protein VH475_19000 [Tepidisphaeraceae bacterium]|jgi:hypothetical protein
MNRFLLAILPLVCLAAGPVDAPAPSSRFAAIDVMIDPKGQPLAAWQIEFAAETGQVSLVGVESGEPGAYAKRPPYYDPAALAGNRIILGDYSLDPAIPKTKIRVARLMLEIRGAAKPQYVTKLITAADPDGKAIPANVSVNDASQPRSGDKK